MRSSLSALAALEARRLLLHPFVLAGLALSVWMAVATLDSHGQLKTMLLMGMAVLPLALGTFAASHLAALRSRRAGSEELLDTLPQDARVRTGAQLLAVLAALPPAVAVLAGCYLLFGAGDGLIIAWDGTRRVPAFVELAQGPLLVLALGALGVFLGRVGPIAPIALVLPVVIVVAEVPLAAWTPDSVLRWAVPLANDIVAVPDSWVACEPLSPQNCGIVDHFDTTALAWHLLALAGTAAAFAAAALATRWTVRAGYAVGALAVVVLTTWAAV
ncbi:hypothetical protein C8N24_0139 [Solirubrobacter pauli]|uniref:ABC-2 type transport system permease protein n=1 Tax=Solirubrobacter pauli TaxID=166793 RepID=A0A660L5R0_9ACTN|nr:hypothetical protein [Solirubrobacter pauli]RKQ90338.1 hypothetical protein C8N24_0139 [Solirubrobacter pauli]